MKIAKVEVIPFSIPFYSGLALKFAYRTSASADHVLIRAYSDTGVVGIAEAPARPQIYGETQESICAVITRHFAPMITGMDPFDLDRIHALLDKIPHNYCAKASIDIALHDMLGKHLDIPLYKMLGGKRADSIPLSWMVGMNSTEQMVEECLSFRQKGFNAFKIKAGLNLKEDLKNFIAIREALGDDAFLYIDGNMGFSSLHQSIETVNAMHEHGLSLVEEPLPLENFAIRARFAESIHVPLMGDESCVTPQAVARELAGGVVGIVLVKLARTGFYKTRKIMALCESARVPVIIGSQGDTSIGAAASAHLAVSFQNVLSPAEISYHLRMDGELLAQPPVIKDGALVVSDRPGIGCEIDEQALKKFRT